MGTLAIRGGAPVRTADWPHWPQWSERELPALQGVLERGVWGGYDQAVRDFEAAWAARLEADHCIAAVNGTITLVAALQALGIGPGDEVIVPPYTFNATAGAVRLAGATPVFADIELETFNLDMAAVEAALSPRVKAIIPVHFAGLPVDLDALLPLADRHDLLVIEDAAHAHGSTWRGKPVGALAHVGSFSFQTSKNLTAGEGGALVTNNADLADTLWQYVNQGRTRTGAWYEHPHLGSNLRLSGWQAAVLSSQLAAFDDQLERRMANARRLRAMLEEVDGLTPLAWDDRVEKHAHHLFIMRYDPAGFGGLTRDQFVAALTAEGIPASGGYPRPLYAHAPLGPEHSRIEPCPNAEQVCAQAVWLTQNMLLDEPAAMDQIMAAVVKIREHHQELVVG